MKLPLRILVAVLIGGFVVVVIQANRPSIPDSGAAADQRAVQEQVSSAGGELTGASQQSAPIDWDDSSNLRRRLEAAVHRAAKYLVKHQDSDGRFVYLRHTDPAVQFEPDYNILRHAGTMYALGMYQQRYPKSEVLEALLKANRFLRAHAVGPVQVDGEQRLLAVWSRPEVVHSGAELEAKLGGAGLTLLALCHLEEVAPGTTTLAELQQLAAFLSYMQKPTGEFFCKFIPSKGGRDDSFVSLYYPGEAALGLLMLYRRDQDVRWLESAAKAIAYLARQSNANERTPPDHWMLLATAQLMPLYQESTNLPEPDAIIRHAERTVQDMIADQLAALDDPLLSGCYTIDGRTCPTATRLEGLQAALGFLPLHHRQLREQVVHSTRTGMAFLLSCQIEEGPLEGGFPCLSPRLKPNDARVHVNMEDKMGEIRIDYVQHALSAMLQYLDRLNSN